MFPPAFLPTCAMTKLLMFRDTDITVLICTNLQNLYTAAVGHIIVPKLFHCNVLLVGHILLLTAKEVSSRAMCTGLLPSEC